MNSVKKRRRAVVDPSACVACGCCVKVCPLQAIEIVRGVMAQVRQANAWAAASAPGSVRPASSKSGR